MNVYIIKCGDCFKIGIAQNINTRIMGLQTNNPRKIELCAWLSLPRANMSDARNVEAKIHGDLLAFRLTGEWFTLTKPMFESITSNYGFSVNPDFNLKAWGTNPQEINLEAAYQQRLADLESQYRQYMKETESRLSYWNILKHPTVAKRVEQEVRKRLTYAVDKLDSLANKAIKQHIEGGGLRKGASRKIGRSVITLLFDEINTRCFNNLDTKETNL